MPKTQTERTRDYQKKCDAIMLRPSLAEGRRIRDAAAAAGETVTQYILRAVRAQMEKE